MNDLYWVNCKEGVKEWCQKCELCASGNGPLEKQKALLRQYNVESLFERLAIDIAGPFSNIDAGNKYILVAMDYFKNWTEVYYAIPTHEVSVVRRTCW